MESRALVVFSGGQDSTTCLAIAIKQYGVDKVHAITFDYGQRHRAEIEAAYRIACLAGIASRYERIEVPGILQGASPLVNQRAEVEQYANADVLPGGLEKTFVPMRNQFFLTLAANRAVVIGLEKGCDMSIFTGVSQEDYGGYPDCRNGFIQELAHTIRLSLDSRAGAVTRGELPHLKIVTPLMFLDKEATVKLSESIPGARALLAFSHTCYNGAVPPCGKCHACLLRAKGYDRAGVRDPLWERLDAEASGDAAFIAKMTASIPSTR